MAQPNQILTPRIVLFSEYMWRLIQEAKNPDYVFHAYEMTSANGVRIEAALTYPAMNKAESALVPRDVQLRRLKIAKGGTWYSDDWQPYCGMCATFIRMSRQPYGFKCQCCKNDIGWDLLRLTDSEYRGV